MSKVPLQSQHKESKIIADVNVKIPNDCLEKEKKEPNDNEKYKKDVDYDDYDWDKAIENDNEVQINTIEDVIPLPKEDEVQ